jgi:hypothetical protein
MSSPLTNVQLQPLFVIPGSESPRIGTQNMFQEPSGNIRYSGGSTFVGSSDVDLAGVTLWPPESRMLRETFSSVPVFCAAYLYSRSKISCFQLDRRNQELIFDNQLR